MKIFTQHPASVGETYPEHFMVANRFGWRMIFAGMGCVIHGFLPPLFTTTGSRTVAALYERMVAHRATGGRPASSNATASASAKN